MIQIEKCDFGDSRVEAFTLLRGESSATDPYSGNSVCDYIGDEPNHVATARAALASMLGIDTADIITPHQTHSSNVAVIPPEGEMPSLDGVDAIVTTRRGILLGINTADCVPVLFYAPDAGIIAAAHAGWRGTVAHIAAKTIAAMAKLGANAGNIRVFLGARICSKCFEVGEEVVEQFVAAGLGDETIITRNAATGKAHIDLHAANIKILQSCGVEPYNIQCSARCSKEDPALYSARRMGIASGRTLTAILLR